MQNYIFTSDNLYDDMEIKFFNSILTSYNYEEFRKKVNYVLISYLRKFKMSDTINISKRTI
jgi:hypothetical protein